MRLFSKTAALLLTLSLLSTGNLNTNNSFAESSAKTASTTCESPLRAPLMALGRGLMKTRYQTTINGSEVFNGPQQGVLVLANHPGFTDPPLLISELDRFIKLRPLMKETVTRNAPVKAVANIMRAVLIPDMDEDGRKGAGAAQAAIQSIIDALARGENIILYPSGKIYRSSLEKIGANSAVDRILQALPNTRVVLARSRGLWGSSFGFGATGESPEKTLLKKSLPRAILSIITGGIFFAPKRKVTIDVVEAKDLPRGQGKLAINRYLENFYNEDAPPAMKVPYFWWQGSKPTVIAERKKTENSTNAGLLETVDPATRKAVYEYIAQKVGSNKIKDSDSLEANLGMDSLARVELLVWMGEKFGREVTEASQLKTVGEVLLAAEGKIASNGTVELKPVNKKWFYNDSPDEKLSVPAGNTIPEVFMAQARRHPNRAAIADQISGVLTYRDVVARIMLLKPLIEKIAGDNERIGIMMPASVTATVLTLAAQFAGKTPVMINFTAGKNNIAEAVKLLRPRRCSINLRPPALIWPI
jgi:acyl-[acyl-carrier-protein]-phospholipid O-acyltransferase/long-chain-fatty-acid--[acyl-carrier-protein] ligase